MFSLLRTVRQRSFHNTKSYFDIITINVPKMGDSISEGTIVEWRKNIGDMVANDEIVLVIETDKVSVDVRSSSAGILTEKLSAVDEVVNVGAPIFKLDDKGVASNAPAAPKTEPKTEPKREAVAPAAPPKPVSLPITMSTTNSSSHHERIPSIQFRYGKGRKTSSPQHHATSTSKPTTVYSNYVPSNPALGRPSISKEETEALESGVYFI